MAQEREYSYGDVDDFEVIKDIVVDVLDAKVTTEVKTRHLQYLIGLLEYGLLCDEVKTRLARFSKFFVLLLNVSKISPLVARLLCSIVSSNITKWQVEIVRRVQSNTGSKTFLALLRQIQMMRPDLVPDEGIITVRKPFPELPKKIREMFESASENVADKTFHKVTDKEGPPAKISRMDVVPAAPQYAEVKYDLKANAAYVTQVEQNAPSFFSTDLSSLSRLKMPETKSGDQRIKSFRDFAPLMPSLKLPNVIASCLREVNFHPVVAVKLTNKQRMELNRWIYLTLESELLQSRQSKKKRGMEYLLRLLKRFIAGTGADLPGIFVILVEYLQDWDGQSYRSELFEVLPQLPLQLAAVEEIKTGIIQPLTKIAEGGDDPVKSAVVECIGRMLVNLRYKSYFMQKRDSGVAKNLLKNHQKILGYFNHLCENFLAEPSISEILLERMLIEYSVIFDCEVNTEVQRFTVLPKALRLLILYSPYLDMVEVLCKLLNGYLAKLSKTSDKETVEKLREVQGEIKEFLQPKGVRNLTKSLAFIPVIATYAQSEGIKTLKPAAFKVNENPALIFPILSERFPAIEGLFLGTQTSAEE